MTFEELENELPNGFHDSKICGIHVDFVGRSIQLKMDLLIGLPDTPNAEEYRAGTLEVACPCLFFIEPPDPRYPFVPDGTAFNVDGDSVRIGQSAEVDQLLPVIPQNSTVYRFFLLEWNSFLYLAGSSVAFSWERGNGS